jgi:hypothetical protein
MTGGLRTRRAFLAGLGAGAAALGVRAALAEPRLVEVERLQPGDFVWHPERSPAGPLAIVVSIPDQRVFVYRNGVRIAVSTCSTGKPGHETPTGVFTILEKDKHHHSSTYNNAPMPNMNRLTWSGVALHAGNLPGYPASHGCVRLPLAFSEKLFTITRVGTPVIIADAATFPSAVVHPGMVMSADAAREFEGIVTARSTKNGVGATARAPDYVPASSVIISSAERSLIIIDDGAMVAKAGVTIADSTRPLGNRVFVLGSVDETGKSLRWQQIGYYDGVARPLSQSPLDTIQRIRADKSAVDMMRARMREGLVLVTTDVHLNADTRTGKDFVIMNTTTS